jgi:hypothetical protein
MAANRAKRQAASNLTFVKGNRAAEDLDPVSQQILEVAATGTSIFDPALCELAYRWFCRRAAWCSTHSRVDRCAASSRRNAGGAISGST